VIWSSGKWEKTYGDGDKTCEDAEDLPVAGQGWGFSSHIAL